MRPFDDNHMIPGQDGRQQSLPHGIGVIIPVTEVNGGQAALLLFVSLRMMAGAIEQTARRRRYLICFSGRRNRQRFNSADKAFLLFYQ